MMDVRAFQHVYANVEKEQSPKKRGGFQTLFYTQAGLGEREIEEIEARVLYYPSEGAPAKQLFFVTQAGNAVVGQAVPLPEPDSAGRGGRYLAHCLIFPPEEFAKFGADPLAVLAHAPFLTTVEAALAQGNLETGDLPTLDVTLPETTTDTTLEGVWSREMVQRLVRAGLQAERLAQGRKMLAIIGTPEETRAVLRTALLAVPTARRGACSFDTYFHRCNPVATYCWAVGLPEVPANPNYLEVACAKRTVDDPELPDASTCYERWVLAALDRKALQAQAIYRDQAWLLCEWLDGAMVEPAALRDIPETVLASVFSCCATQVQAILRRRLAQVIGASLAERALPAVQKGAPTALLAQLTAPLDIAALLDMLYQSFAAERFARPSANELTALGGLLTKTEHVGLRIWQTYWAGTAEEARALLARLPDDQYRTFLRYALAGRGADPARLVLPGRGRMVVDALFAAHSIELCDLAILAQALIDAGDAIQLDRLAAHIPGHSVEEVRALQALVKQTPDLPDTFRLEVEDAVRHLPKPSVGGFMKRLFRRQ